jgi:preprotein translocase subunit SecE
MGDTVSNEGTQKKNFFKGLKAEFHKIVWPDKDTVTKQTIAVVSASIALGLIIAIIDLIIKFGLSFIL